MGKGICLSFYLIVDPPIRTNVNIQFCLCFSPSVNQIVYCLSVSVRLLSVCVFKLQIVLLLVCYSIGLYDFFSFVRPSDRPSVHPSCRRSVSLSLMHVCMSVIFLISNSKFLTSNFDIYSRVCMRAYESVRPMCARI